MIKKLTALWLCAVLLWGEAAPVMAQTRRPAKHKKNFSVPALAFGWPASADSFACNMKKAEADRVLYQTISVRIGRPEPVSRLVWQREQAKLELAGCVPVAQDYDVAYNLYKVLFQETLRQKLLTPVEQGVEYLLLLEDGQRRAAEAWRRQGGASFEAPTSTAQHYALKLPRFVYMDWFGKGDWTDPVPYEGKTLTKQAWVHAALRMDLAGLKGKKDWTPSQWTAYQENRIDFSSRMDGDSTFIVRAIQEYGADKADVAAARNYLRDMLNRKDLCKDTRSVIHVSAGELAAQRARNRENAEFELKTVPLCKYSLDVMEALAVLAVQHQDAASERAIYNYMTAKHREKLGGGVVLYGTALLMGIGSDRAYALLKKFLKEQARNSGGEDLRGALSYLSFEGLSEGAGEIVSDGKYLSEYTSKFSYLDKETARRYYPRLDIDLIVRQPLTGDGDYQLPMGNVYEDVGELIAQKLDDPQARKLGKEILLSKAYNAPLTMGVYLGNKGRFAAQELGISNAALFWFGVLRLNYAGENEGTMRRMKEKAAQALAEYSIMTQAEVAKYAQQDTAKFKTYKIHYKANCLLSVGDVLVAVAALPLLLKGVVSGGVKVMGKLGRLRRMGRVSSSSMSKSAGGLGGWVKQAGGKFSGARRAEVSPAVLSAQGYEMTSLEAYRLPKSLVPPPYPVASRPGVMFRGMGLNANGKSLQNIASTGLQLDKVSVENNALLLMMSGERYGAQLSISKMKFINFTNSAKMASRYALRHGKDGNIPVVLQMSGIEDGNIIRLAADVPASHIKQIDALLFIEGAPRWGKLEVLPGGGFKFFPYQ